MNTLDQFELPEDASKASGYFQAKCRHCPSKISGSLKTTSNFVTHLKRKHRDVYLNLLEQKTTEQAKVTSFVKHESVKYNSSDPKQMKLLDALILYVAGDLLPLSTVESPHFRHFVETMDSKFQVPSRKHLSYKLIHNKAEGLKIKLKEEIKQTDSVCLTIDLWSNRQMKGFLGVTGHYIMDWRMKSVMVSCRRFKGKHTAENIRHEYEETVAGYDIGEKVASVVSDNASNMVKAFNFSLPGYLEEKRDDESDECSDENESQEEGTDIDETDSDSVFSDDSCFPKHMRCYAHSLQLVVKDGFVECGSHMKSYCKSIYYCKLRKESK